MSIRNSSVWYHVTICNIYELLSLSHMPYIHDRLGHLVPWPPWPEESKCRGYNKAQETVCQCLPKSQVKEANEKKLKAFYQKFNPEKLDDKGGAWTAGPQKSPHPIDMVWKYGFHGNLVHIIHAAWGRSRRKMWAGEEQCLSTCLGSCLQEVRSKRWKKCGRNGKGKKPQCLWPWPASTKILFMQRFFFWVRWYMVGLLV